MKNKMRFSRSLADVGSVLETMLPHNIQEEFPLNFEQEFVVRLVERQIRSKRSINNSASGNHHHHHHHDHHEEDRGCTILGIHYQLGEVIGEFAVASLKLSQDGSSKKLRRAIRKKRESFYESRPCGRS